MEAVWSLNVITAASTPAIRNRDHGLIAGPVDGVKMLTSGGAGPKLNIFLGGADGDPGCHDIPVNPATARTEFELGRTPIDQDSAFADLGPCPTPKISC